ncbi:50S ribosomal protein L17 [Halpernia sp.]|uniref:50S ribosomal protein L17 n=1 Tax=Halpernia sp. TaxID=2782209 RepID=UPI003A95501B
MRHGKKFNHLGRTTSHRSAMLSNMACSLIEHKRINTTVAKAKALRVFVEPILTKSKEDSTHNRRTVFSYLQSKEAVTELFRTIAPKIAERPGGYTRIIKTGFRLGDAADMAMIELVDFNDIYNPNEAEKKTTRRSRSASKAKKAQPIATIADAKVEAKAEETVTDAVVEEPTVEAADTTEEKTAE